MKAIVKELRGFVADESGAAAVEYGMLVALIAVVIIAAVTLLGTNLREIFNYIAGKIGDAIPGGEA